MSPRYDPQEQHQSDKLVLKQAAYEKISQLTWEAAKTGSEINNNDSIKVDGVVYSRDKNMSNKIMAGVSGLVLLCLASLVNGATVRLTPSSQNVVVGSYFSLAVTGADFTDLVTSGSITLTWDPVDLTLVTTPSDVFSSIFRDTGFFSTVNFTPGQLDVTMTAFSPVPTSIPIAPAIGPDFNLFTIDFRANPPPIGLTTVDILTGFDGAWQSALLQDYMDVTYAGASFSITTPIGFPLPPALWLFGSGLLGLIGIARRKAGYQLESR